MRAGNKQANRKIMADIEKSHHSQDLARVRTRSFKTLLDDVRHIIEKRLQEAYQGVEFVKLSHVGSSVGSDVTSSVTSLSPVKLTERQQNMLELIRKNPIISAQQMSVVLSVVKRTIERDLADLQKKGILIREGNTSAGHWEIIEK